jgi:hypothetical protein
MAEQDRRIEIELAEAGRMFSLLGVSPFQQTYDCITGIERLVEEVARLPDLGAGGATVVLRLPEPGTATEAEETRQAIGRYTRSHAEDDLRLADAKMREGIQTLRLSMAVVVAVILLVAAIDQVDGLSPFLRGILSSALVITGWVAVWRPLDLLLYEPWILRRQAKILRAIEAMPVVIEPGVRG